MLKVLCYFNLLLMERNVYQTFLEKSVNPPRMSSASTSADPMTLISVALTAWLLLRSIPFPASCICSLVLCGHQAIISSTGCTPLNCRTNLLGLRRGWWINIPPTKPSRIKLLTWLSLASYLYHLSQAEIVQRCEACRGEAFYLTNA